MSDKDETEPPKSQVFNIRDFMDFLAGQDISKLAVLTKSGTLLSASFNNEPSGSMDSSILKTLFKSMEQHTSSDNLAGQHTISLETSQIPESVAKACNSRDWAVEYEKSHVDVTYNHFFSISEHGEKPSQIPSTASFADRIHYILSNSSLLIFVTFPVLRLGLYHHLSVDFIAWMLRVPVD